jgi:hypothetical protein
VPGCVDAGLDASGSDDSVVAYRVDAHVLAELREGDPAAMRRRMSRGDVPRRSAPWSTLSSGIGWSSRLAVNLLGCEIALCLLGRMTLTRTAAERCHRRATARAAPQTPAVPCRSVRLEDLEFFTQFRRVAMWPSRDAAVL